MFSRREWVIAVLLGWIGVILFPSAGWSGLDQYVRKPEAAYAWKLKEKMEVQESRDKIYDLQFTSQTWQGYEWRHQLQVYQPRNTPPNSILFVWVTGGSSRPAHVLLGLELARRINAPVAFLYHIPNQPLLDDNLREDDLVAETFVRYLKTKDENWPLLFPMVKSVVKAMDVLQAFGKQEWNNPINSFIVAGASKRGWTTWLTAAVDSRVRAIAPAVIDTLNMREQMPRQLKVFGAYSARLAPYSSRGLLPIPDTPEGQKLLSMVDPWAYRDRLALPKLIVNGTNDFYWATDALNLYWNDLRGDKWVVYVPNAGHALVRQDTPGPDQWNHLINALAAFTRHQMNGTSMPRLEWRHTTVDGKLRLTINASPPPTDARFWVAETSTKDFRTARWTAQPAEISNETIIGELVPAETGHRAFFGELDYKIDGLKYHLSTQIRITD